MSQEYMWFEIDANRRIGKKQLRVLNQKYIEHTLANYLINPMNRKEIRDLPKMIKNIEQHTTKSTPSDNEQDRWTQDKMGEFISMLEAAYKNIMNDPVDSLIDDYIPSLEQMGKNPKKGTYWERLADFKGEHYVTNPDTDEQELVEGSGIPKNLKLKELLNKDDAKDFIGSTVSIGKGRGKYQSALQKKLLKKQRKFNRKELFGLSPRDDSVLSHISVKFNKPDKPYDDSEDDKEPTSKSYGTIEVNFSIDHTNGTVSRSIFEKAGLPKWVIEDDPVSYGKAIRSETRGWSMSKDKPDSGGGGTKTKGWDLQSIWWTPSHPGAAAQKEKKRERYLDYLSRYWRKFQKDTNEIFSGLSGGYEDVEKELKEVEAELESLTGEKITRYGVTLEMMPDPTYQRYNAIGDLEVLEEDPRMAEIPKLDELSADKRTFGPRIGTVEDKKDRPDDKKIRTRKQDLLDKIEDRRQLLRWTQIHHPRVHKGLETFKEALDKTMAQNDAPTEKHKIEGERYTQEALDEHKGKYSIQLEAGESEQLIEVFRKAYTPIVADKYDLGEKYQDTNWIRDLVEEMIHQDKRMYKYLEDKVLLDPWLLLKTNITLEFKYQNVSDNSLLLESSGKVENAKRVSDTFIHKPAQMKGKSQRKHAVRPFTRRSGGHAQKANPMEGQERLGRNAVRARFVKKLSGRNKALKKAAQSIGAELEV
jgi:arsenate reductase-like glutaredoxin family protein